MADQFERSYAYSCECGTKWRSELAAELCKGRKHQPLPVFVNKEAEPFETKKEPRVPKRFLTKVIRLKGNGKCVDCGIPIEKTGRQGPQPVRCDPCKLIKSRERSKEWQAKRYLLKKKQEESNGAS